MPACESIILIFLAMQNDFEYVAHYYFKDVCTFDFEGDKAVNSGLKRDSISVFTYMKMHTLAGTQLKIGENQSMKIYK